MDLKIKDVAELLSVSETTIRRWLSDGRIPAYKLRHQYRFSRTEIENWMLSQRLGSSPIASEKEIYSAEEEGAAQKGWQQFSLFRAIHKGVVIQKQPVAAKNDLIRHIMRHIAPAIQSDPDGISDMLLERESLMPTAIGQGIAVPHTRDFLLRGSLDVVCPVFLSEPIDWGALDNEPVDTLFFLFASDDKKHLNLLAKLAHLAKDEEMRTYLRTSPDKTALLEKIKQWEAK